MSTSRKTPVIVAQLSNAVAGKIFGVSKVKGGNRFATIHVAAMVVILYLEAKKAQAGVTV
ncbi:Uu.00g087070.m01.CDS01 [Anthostomella pinea]|uniref:Uu.00g087070.m01.CDS01 n=1 Tax=Anthostomella pinea TaxID=933095 RepID=A0AAI8VM73_9PEZI|nr:Uu.00g087070.m01.CDS01 [Anthostomella pinea]